ncbi:MAG: DUF5906 domain-containing protein [Thermofilaceae archaeon]|nr:DUF5906 domain-containing protein [Thermofilaceae archaeon]MDW8004949.1 DUF5906 domain-containing protein [Thermofilaceae archaeon]
MARHDSSPTPSLTPGTEDETGYKNVSVEVLEQWQVQDIVVSALTSNCNSLNPAYKRAALDYILIKMLKVEEVAKKWTKMHEKALKQGESPLTLKEFILQNYTEFLRTLLLVAKEGGVIPVKMKRHTGYDYYFVKDHKLIDCAEQKLLEASTFLLDLGQPAGTLEKARATIAQNGVTLDPSQLNPPGFILTENGLEIDLLTQQPVSNSYHVFSHFIRVELKPADLDGLKSLFERYDWAECEELVLREKAPTFLQLLSNMFPTEKERAQVREAFGALFLPEPVRAAFIIVGEPGIGKSVMADALKDVLGEYATALDFETLFSSEGKKIVGELAGRYANIVSESARNMLTRRELFKRLTGDVEIDVEVKYRRPFRTRNYCKHYVFSNELPLFKKIDPSTLERMYIIECTGTRPEKPNPNLRKELAKEKKGIFFWLLLNLHYFLKKGCKFEHKPTTEDVERLVLQAASPISEFIETYCETGSSYSEAGGELYTAYLQFAKLRGDLEPLGRNTFYNALRAHGFQSYERHHQTWFKGLRLLKTEDTRSHLADY